MSLTILQKSNASGVPKPGELIEITGAHALEASDRALFNVLYQYAHDTGRLAEANAEWEVPMARLRSAISRHKGNERIRDSLDRLMRVVVNVPFIDGRGVPRILKTHLFDFFDLPGDEEAAGAVVRYGVPKKLAPVIASSARWGRIRAEIACAMSSKYGIALYELVRLRAGLERCLETFPIERFRDLLGVPPGA